MNLTPKHYWIVFVASLGQMIGTAVATLAGIVIPMINILRHPELSVFMQGLIGSMDLIGIMVGSVLFGKLSDKYGYLFFFRFCPCLVLAGALLTIFFPTITILVISLFIIGLGIGGEYSLDSDYTSELMPEKYRSVMIGLTKTASALGNIIVAAVCFLLLSDWKSADTWPDLFFIIAIIAGCMILLRIRFYESPKWLLDKGRIAEAEKAAEKFLGKDVRIKVPETPVKPVSPTPAYKDGFLGFLKNNIPQVILSGIPWACEGLGVYGIGVFLPILVIALGLESSGAGELPIFHVISSVKVTFYISCIILPGFIIGLWLITKKKSIIAIQSRGFWGCAVALVVLLLAYHFKWMTWISLIAFMAFELFLNIGPHLVTYVLPPRIYPISDRGLGTGVAAAIGKVGAVLGVFCVPLLLHAGGAVLVLTVSAAVMAIGALVTKIFGSIVFKNDK